MYAQDIVVATKKLQHFGFRSKIYAYFFLCASTLALVLWAMLGAVQSFNTILVGLCMLLIPTAVYFSGAVVEKITDQILKCKVASVEEFDTSFRGPFSGMSWVIFSITFFLACAEILFDFYFERAFGMYSLFLITFTLVWLARFYAYFRYLKKSIDDLRDHADGLDLKDVPRSKRAIVEEVQRGNTETLVDKRDDLSSL
jgi:hypothetical protein